MPAEPRLSDLQRTVFDLIRSAGWAGMTVDEVEVATKLTHQSASARVNELEKMKLIERRAAKRKTRSGRGAHIFVPYGLKDTNQEN